MKDKIQKVFDENMMRLRNSMLMTEAGRWLECSDYESTAVQIEKLFVYAQGRLLTAIIEEMEEDNCPSEITEKVTSSIDWEFYHMTKTYFIDKLTTAKQQLLSSKE